MKLIRSDDRNGIQWSALKHGGIVPLISRKAEYPTILSIIADGPDGLNRIGRLVDPASPTIGSDEVQLLAPIERTENSGSPQPQAAVPCERPGSPGERYEPDDFRTWQQIACLWSAALWSRGPLHYRHPGGVGIGMEHP